MGFIIENTGALEHGDINMEAFIDAFSREMAKEQRNEVDGQVTKYFYDEIGPREGYTTRFRYRPAIERPQNSIEIIYEFKFDSMGSALQYRIRVIFETSGAINLALKIALKIIKKSILTSFDRQVIPRLVAYMQTALDGAHKGE